MKLRSERVFLYHADANAIGGVLRRPFPAIISSQASSSLASAGGHGSSRIDDFQLDDTFRCEAAYSHVSGSVDEDGDGSWTSRATAVVEGLNLLEIVTADRVVSQISVKHTRVGYGRTVSLAGSQIVNLRVNGQPVHVDLDLNTLGKTVSRPSSEAGRSKLSFGANPDLVRVAAEQSRKLTGSDGVPAWVKDRYGWLGTDNGAEQRGFVLCSMVSQAKAPAPAQVYGHIVHIPDFGDLIIGELVVDANSYQLVMLRAEMGCLADGTITLSSTRTNGVTYP